MEQSKALMSPADQAEWDKLAGEGAQHTGGRRGGLFIPTIKLNNSDKVKAKYNIPLGSLYLTFKENEVQKVEDLGMGIAGVILKTSYSIKSIYDPNKQVSFFSREFDDFFNDEITVLDGNTKEIHFKGSYKQWKEENQIKSSRGSKNDFVLVVHLYILQDADFEKLKVARVSITGKSMSNWFSYTNGDKEKGIDSIYAQGVQPHTHIHELTSVEDKTPKGEPYWYISFAFGDRLEIEQLRQVVKLQKELTDQLNALRGRKPKEEAPALPTETGFEEKTALAAPKVECTCTPVITDGKAVHTEDCKLNEIRIEDVPF